MRQIRFVGWALAAIILIGTAGYMFLLGWPFLDALYMSIVTVTTVG